MDKIKVLVIEDEWTIAQNTKEVLEKLNYAVPALVTTGEEAIQKAIELQPDLVLMDIFLQGKVDGIEAAQQIQNRCNIPVVFLSAYSDAKTLQRVNATQPYGYLVKPIIEGTLNTTIEIALSRHKATVELHAQLAAVLDSSDNAVIGEMLDGTIASWNPGAEKIFGYRASEAIARPISILVPPNGVDEMPQILERIARGEKVEHYETVRMRKDGQLIDVCLTISPLKDATGNVVGVSEIVRDLTEDKRNRHLLQQQSLLSNLIEGSTDSIAALDLDFRYIACNSAYKARFFKIAGREIEIGTSMIEALTALPPEEQAKIVERWRRALAGEHFTAIEDYTDLGGQRHYYEITCSSIRDSQGQLVGASQIAKNITARKQAEAALHKSEALLKEAQSLARLGNWEFDLSTQKSTWSEEIFRICGLDSTESEPDYAGVMQLFHPDDGETYHQLVQRALADGTPYDTDLRYYRSDGTLGWLNVRGKAVFDSQGRVIRLFGTAQDITDRKQVEEQLQQAHQKLTFLIQNTPLAAIEWDSQFRVQSWSQRAEEIFGWKAEEVLGKTMHEWRFIFEDDLNRVNQSANRQLNGASIYTTCENRNYTKDGSVIDCQWYNSALLDESGNLVSMLSLAHDISDRKRAETACRLSEERLQLSLEGSGDAWWDWDISSGQVSWSPRLWGMLGYEDDELPKEFSTWERLMHPDDKPRVMELLEAHLKDSSVPYQLEHRLLSKSGEWKWIASYGRVMVRDETGQPLRMSGTHRDINERKQSEEALRMSQEQLQLSLEGSDEGWWDWNILTGEAQFSPRWYTMLGYDASEFLPEFSAWERLIHPDDRSGVMELLEAHLKDSLVPYQLDYRLLTKSGEWKWIANYGRVVVRDETGKPLRMSGTHRDITERKQAEEERAQLLLQIEYERSRLEAVLMQMPAAIWIVEAPSGKVILDNNKVESVLGHPPPLVETMEDLSQSSAIHLDGSPDAAEEYFMARSLLALPLGQSLLTGEVVTNEEHLYRKGDGSLATLSLYSSPIYDANGQMIAVVVAAFDITEQKQAQEQIQAALREKDVLLQEIHDRVKNNLQILNSLLQMQSRRVQSSETVLALRDTRNRIESIALVHEKLYRSENLANVDFSQYIPALTIHLFDTYNVSSNTVKLKLNVERIFLEIKTGIPCGLIINELVSNSLKHAFANNRQGKIQIEFHTNREDLLTLVVRDNGVGLPEKFDLEAPQSLGLTLVYELVDQLEGTLELDRSRGTEFRITFPRTPI